MRAFKTTKDATLAKLLLEFVKGEETPPKIKGACVNGYVKESVLQQYFGDIRKKYPEADVVRVLDVLVKAGLLEQCQR